MRCDNVALHKSRKKDCLFCSLTVLYLFLTGITVVGVVCYDI